MSTELRCPSKLHSVVMLENGLWVLEVRCRSTFCGYQSGVVVLHRFGLNGELINTLRFKDPANNNTKRKKVNHGAHEHPDSIRTA